VEQVARERLRRQSDVRRQAQAGEVARADPETRRINGKRVPRPGGDDENARERLPGVQPLQVRRLLRRGMLREAPLTNVIRAVIGTGIAAGSFGRC
jgi:hypothetical protein